MEYEDEAYDQESGKAEGFKVFVSRIPSKWTSELLEQHFTSLGFGAVLKVSTCPITYF